MAEAGFARRYLFSRDHKVIGIQYYFLALTAVFVGMLLSLLMRIHMVWPTASIPFFGDIKPETYVMLVTMHGTIMVFFVLTTAPQGGFGNYFLPIQIGAPDMAFPVLNMLSFWTTFVAFITILAAFFVTGGAPLHGWTGYAPLSALTNSGPGEQLGADLWITSIAIFCIASLMGALNRKFLVSGAHRIPDLFDDYLFEVPAELPLPPFSRQADDTFDVAIIAGKLLYSQSEVGQLRLGRQLFAETVFCSERAAGLLQGLQSPLSDNGKGEKKGDRSGKSGSSNAGLPAL